jgi:hypothetical protein
VNLCLDNDAPTAEPLGDLADLGSGERNFASRHRHAVPREDRFGLIFVNFHGIGPEEESGMSRPAMVSVDARVVKRSNG